MRDRKGFKILFLIDGLGLEMKPYDSSVCLYLNEKENNKCKMLITEGLRISLPYPLSLRLLHAEYKVKM